ncbi:MAG: D-aminoacylase [Lachnospiraceae bacterium]|nr:D-aminoacylase [Lachnospiraceae bacterium]
MDILIKNAKIIDGSGEPARFGNVGIDGGKIVLNDLPETADLVIDAKRRVLAPGFIDAHSHGDLPLGCDFGDLCKLNQGITTQLAGQCGSSVAPLSDESRDTKAASLEVYLKTVPKEIETWDRWSTYLDYAEKVPKALNTGLFVGCNTIRMAVMGVTDRKPTAEENRRMQELLIDAMEHGALGMSTGLAYVPGTYTDTDDVVEIAKVMAPYGGIYTTHMRNESFDLVRSVRETIEIGRRAGVAVNISHFKALGRANWGTTVQAIEEIEKARAEGITVTVDQYPYDASMTILHACIPPWYFSKGNAYVAELLRDPAERARIRREMENPASDYENCYLNCGSFENITISLAPANPDAEGLSVQEYADKIGKDPFDTFFDLILDNKFLASACYHCIGEEDMERIFLLPYSVVGTDGLVYSMNGKCHPRGWGSMVHAIYVYCKKRGLISLESVIRKISALPAEIYHLKGKGRILDGYDADLVLFDEERLKDTATYLDPARTAEGIDMVFVGGECVLKDGKLTGKTPGRIILRES